MFPDFRAPNLVRLARSLGVSRHFYILHDRISQSDGFLVTYWFLEVYNRIPIWMTRRVGLISNRAVCGFRMMLQGLNCRL